MAGKIVPEFLSDKKKKKKKKLKSEVWKVSKQIQPLCFLLTLPSWWYSANKHMPNYTLVHTSTTRGHHAQHNSQRLTEDTIHNKYRHCSNAAITYKATLSLTTSTLFMEGFIIFRP